MYKCKDPSKKIKTKVINRIAAKFVDSRDFVFKEVGEVFNDFYNHHLPFPLTNAQKRVIKEIRKDKLLEMTS